MKAVFAWTRNTTYNDTFTYENHRIDVFTAMVHMIASNNHSMHAMQCVYVVINSHAYCRITILRSLLV